MRCLSPAVLELTLITTKQPDPAFPDQWNFVDRDNHLHLPATNEFVVTIAGTNIPVAAIGFKRRVLYAPLKQSDLRIGNYLYLQLTAPIADHQKVKVNNPDEKLWPPKCNSQPRLTRCAGARPFMSTRWDISPRFRKKRWLAFIPAASAKRIYQRSAKQDVDWRKNNRMRGHIPAARPISESSRPGQEKIYQAGKLTGRTRVFPFHVIKRSWKPILEIKKTPGEYRVSVPGLGASFPFFIDDAMRQAAFARTYALGLYHQRCGTDNGCLSRALPRTPATSRPPKCPPCQRLKFTSDTIAQYSADFADNRRNRAAAQR